MSTRVQLYGGHFGEYFDDGVMDDVRNVIMREDSKGFAAIKIEYMRDGNPVSGVHRDMPGRPKLNFYVDYPDEYITAITGSYRMVPGSSKTILSHLQFETSHGRTSKVFGKYRPTQCTRFRLEGETGRKVVGFAGICDNQHLSALGARFELVSPAIKQIKPHGGIQGKAWDDGANYDGLMCVAVGDDGHGLNYIRFQYLKGMLIHHFHSHGKKPQDVKMFVLDYQNHEHIKLVEVTYNLSGVISSLRFTTTKQRQSEIYGTPVGTRFILEAKGFDKVVGFRGRSSDDRICALGAHFAANLIPPIRKLQGRSGNYGEPWDDGIHDNIWRIQVRSVSYGVCLVKFQYTNGIDKVTGDVHGMLSQLPMETYELTLTDGEYITSIEGFLGRIYQTQLFDVVTMLKFTTNKRVQVLGNPDHPDKTKPFVLKYENHMIVGFHGTSAEYLTHIGAYVKPL